MAKITDICAVFKFKSPMMSGYITIKSKNSRQDSVKRIKDGLFSVLLCGCIFVMQPVVANEFVEIKNNIQFTNKNINSIVQDSNGFIWISTSNDIARFDGYEFKRLKGSKFEILNDEEIQINSLNTDKKHDIWISTDKGLIYFNVKSDSFQKVISSKLIGKAYLSITDDHNNVWVISSKGIFIVNSKSDKVKRLNLKKIISEDFRKAVITWDPNGNLIISAKQGIFAIHSAKSLKSDFDFEKSGKLHIRKLLDNNGKTSILYDQFGYAWVWNTEGVRVYDSKKGDFNQTIHTINIKDITEIHELSNHDIWIGIRGNGNLQLQRDKTGTIVYKKSWFLQDMQVNDMKNSTNCYFEDKDHNMWVGTKDGLFVRKTVKERYFRHYKSKYNDDTTLSHNTVSGIYTSADNSTWVATANGLNKVNINPFDKTITFTRYFNQNNNKLETIAEDNDGLLWIGTKTKMVFFDPVELQFVQKKEVELLLDSLNVKFARSIVKDKSGNIFIGFVDGGVVVVDSKTKSTVRLAIKSSDKPIEDCYALAIDKNNTLWVGSKSQGVFEVNYDVASPTDTYTYKEYKLNDDHLSKQDWIRTIHCDPVNTIWVGTADGLFKLNRESLQFQQILLNNHNKSNYISGIISDEIGNIWISMLNSYCRISISDNQHTFFELTEGGFSRENFVYGIGKDNLGNLWMGGIDGLTQLKPMEFKNATNTHKPVITEFKVANIDFPAENELNNCDKIILKHKDDLISLSFSSLNYSAPAKIMYSYKLEGLDSEWTQVDGTRRFASYTNLKRGIYRFKLKSTDENGIWTSNERSLTIQVLPSPWLSWWMIIIYLLSLSLVGVVILKIFIRWNKLKYEDRLSRYRLEIYTNLIYSFKTPLSLLQSPLKTLTSSFETLPVNKVKDQLQLMQSNSLRLTQIINQLVDFQKIDDGKIHLNLIKTDFIQFVKRIHEQFNSLAIHRSIEFTFHSNVESLELTFDAEKIENSIFQIVANAFQFTPSHKQIELSCMYQPEERKCWIKVKDTGAGIQEEHLQQIFQRFWSYNVNNENNLTSGGMGLALARDFIRLHNGEIEVQSTPLVGTEVSFYLFTENMLFTQTSVQEFNGNTDFQKFTLNYVDTLKEIVPAGSFNKKLPFIYFVDEDVAMRNFIIKNMSDIANVISFANWDLLKPELEKRVPELIISEVLFNNNAVGYEFCSQLKQDSKHKHIPFLFLSSLSKETDIEKGYEVGAYAYYLKPFDEKFLHSRVQYILNFNVDLKEKIKRDFLINPKEIKIQSLDDRFLQKVIQTLENNITNEKFNVDVFAKQMNLSTAVFYRKLKRLTDKSPVEFIVDYKLNKAIQLLESNAYSVAEIAEKLGYFDYRYFSTSFKKHFGVTPTSYKKDKAPHSDSQGLQPPI